MRASWQLQEAKARFSELVDTAARKGPQTVTRHGKPVVVVVAAHEYRRLIARGSDFKRFLRRAPLHELDLTRNGDTGRNIAL